MNKQQAIKSLAHDLMFCGCQKINEPAALELSEKILDGKVPFLTQDNDSELKKRISIQSEANKNAAMEAMSKFIPEKISEENTFILEVKHWHNSFVSASLCSGKGVSESIEYANDAISSLYGPLSFELISKK